MIVLLSHRYYASSNCGSADLPVSDGTCLVRFDNEPGKGDHKHVGGHKKNYRFIDVATLVAEFFAEIEKARRK